MITPLIAAALIATSGQAPDHLVREPVNMNKPHTGGYAEEIVDAATIPKKWRAFAACCDRESGGTLDKSSRELGLTTSSARTIAVPELAMERVTSVHGGSQLKRSVCRRQ